MNGILRKAFFEITKNSQKNTCVGVSVLVFNSLGLVVTKGLTYLKYPAPKKKLRHRYFPVNFPKFLRTPFFKEHLRRLHLNNICARGIFLKRHTETVIVDFFKFLMASDKVET